MSVHRSPNRQTTPKIYWNKQFATYKLAKLFPPRKWYGKTTSWNITLPKLKSYRIVAELCYCPFCCWLLILQFSCKYYKAIFMCIYFILLYIFHYIFYFIYIIYILYIFYSIINFVRYIKIEFINGTSIMLFFYNLKVSQELSSSSSSSSLVIFSKVNKRMTDKPAQ